MGCVWCIVRAVNSAQDRYWIWFGLLAGLGMETKYTMVFFGFGVFVALLATPERRFLKSGALWIGAMLAFLVFLPNLIWVAVHHFPFLELMHNVRGSGRDVVRGPLEFIGDQAFLMNPILLPLWAGGLVWLFFGGDGRRFRILGWIYAVMLATFIILKGKNYYLASVYPMLFAAGAVACEKITRGRWAWTRTVYIVFVAAAIAMLAPTVAPVFVQGTTTSAYQSDARVGPPKAENPAAGVRYRNILQDEEFSWEEMARGVLTARVFQWASGGSARAVTAIFANSYEVRGWRGRFLQAEMRSAESDLGAASKLLAFGDREITPAA